MEEVDQNNEEKNEIKTHNKNIRLKIYLFLNLTLMQVGGA